MNESVNKISCPKPEHLARLLTAGQAIPEADQSDRRDAAGLRAHVEGCESCAAELEFIRAMQIEPGETESFLEETFSEAPFERIPLPPSAQRAFHDAAEESKTVRSFPLRFFRIFTLRTAFPLAAAAVLVAVLVPLWLQRDRGAEPVFRDAASHQVMHSLPGGVIDRFPDLIEWPRVEEARIYLCELYSGDLHLLWSMETEGSTISVPEQILARITELGGGIIQITAYSGTPLIESHRLVVWKSSFTIRP